MKIKLMELVNWEAESENEKLKCLLRKVTAAIAPVLKRFGGNTENDDVLMPLCEIGLEIDKEIGVAEVERALEYHKHEIERLNESIRRYRMSIQVLTDEVFRLKAAIQRALDDEESGTGWGPDVTVCGYLQEALMSPKPSKMPTLDDKENE